VEVSKTLTPSPSPIKGEGLGVRVIFVPRNIS